MLSFDPGIRRQAGGGTSLGAGGLTLFVADKLKQHHVCSRQAHLAYETFFGRMADDAFCVTAQLAPHQGLLQCYFREMGLEAVHLRMRSRLASEWSATLAYCNFFAGHISCGWEACAGTSPDSS